MKIIYYICFLPLALSQSVFSADKLEIGNHEFGSKGYFRLGTGTSADGTNTCFKAPGAGAKSRLGNECESWIELDAYDKYYLNKSKTGPYLLTEGRLTFAGADNEPIEFNDIGELFIEFGFNKAKIWVGRRWYDRHDIHINDFFFLNNTSGDGGGIYDLDIMGFGKFAYTYLQNSETPNISSLELNDKITNRSHDFRFSDIKTNTNGKLLAFLNYSNIVGREINNSFSIEDADGFALGLVHKQDNLFGGYNKFSIAYGRGTARNAGAWAFESSETIGKLTTPQQADKLENASTLRITNQNVIENHIWAMMIALAYEKKDYLEFDGTDQTWFSFGVRPVKFINKHFRILGEFGYDKVENHVTDINGSLRKFTLAAELANEPKEKGLKFEARPVIRVFVTHAQWSDEFHGQIGGEAYTNSSHGLRYGIQVETWW